MLENRQLWAVSLIMTIRSAAMGGIWPYMAIFLNERLSVPVAEIGITFALLAVLSAFFQIVGGYMADFFGRKSAMILAAAGGIMTYFGLILLLNYSFPAEYLMVLFAFTSFSGGIIAPASNAMVADVTPPGERERGYAVYRVLTNLGWAAGAIAVSVLYAFGMIRVFLLVDLLMAVQLLIIVLYIRETRAVTPRGTVSLKQRLRQFAVLDKSLTLFSAATLLITIMIAQFSVTLSLFSALRVNIQPSDIGYIYALNGVVVVLGQMPAIGLVRRINDFNGLILGAMLYMAGYFLVGFSHNLPALLFDMVIITMGENFTTPTISTIISKLSPPDKMGRYMAFNQMANSAGRALGPAVGSVFFSILAFGPSLWGTLDLFGLAGVLLLLAVRKSGMLSASSYTVIRA